MNKICTMFGVKEYGDGSPVELHVDDATGHLIVVAFNEGGDCATYVDFNDLIEWARHGPRFGSVIQMVDANNSQ